MAPEPGYSEGVVGRRGAWLSFCIFERDAAFDALLSPGGALTVSNGPAGSRIMMWQAHFQASGFLAEQ